MYTDSSQHLNSPYTNNYSLNKRVVLKVNPNFVVSISLFFAMLICSGIISYHVFFLKSYLVTVDTRSIGLVVKGEFVDMAQAMSAATVDKQTGGAGYLHKGENGLYRIYSRFDQHGQQDSAYIKIPNLKFLVTDENEGAQLADILNFPILSTTFLGQQLLADFRAHRASFGLVTYHFDNVKQSFLEKTTTLTALAKDSEIDPNLKNQQTLPYAKLLKLYQTLTENLQQLQILKPTLLSTLLNFSIASIMEISTTYHTI